MPLSRCVLALAPLIRLVKARKEPVLSGVWCVVVWCRVCAEKHKKTEQKKKGEQKRWTHGDKLVLEFSTNAK